MWLGALPIYLRKVGVLPSPVRSYYDLTPLSLTSELQLSVRSFVGHMSAHWLLAMSGVYWGLYIVCSLCLDCSSPICTWSNFLPPSIICSNTTFSWKSIRATLLKIVSYSPPHKLLALFITMSGSTFSAFQSTQLPIIYD